MCVMCCVFQILLLSPRRVVSVIFLVLCLFSYSFSKSIRISKRELVDDSVQRYLMKFGYMPRTADGAFALRTEESVRDAIKEMQEFAGIPVTGRLDQQTTKLLNTPRCGVPDKNIQTSGRRKRFTLHGQKWPYTNLTWSLRSRNLALDLYQVRLVISKALEVWSRHSKLTFTEVDSDRADILIYFHRGEHGDNFPFDGKGIILAHAFFPNGGRSIDVHFDADESWTTIPNGDQGTNLFNVAAHEFGHSLGLSHSSIEGALMYPWYKEMEDGFDYELPEDDKLAIQTLYGARTTRLWDTIRPYPRRPVVTPPTTTTTTTTTRRPYLTRPPERPYNPRNPNDRYPHYPHYPKPYYPIHPDKKNHYPKNEPRFHPPGKYPIVHKYPEIRPERTTRYPLYNPDKAPDRKHHSNDKESSGKKPPDTCDTSYDSVAVIRREVFFFKDAYFWRIGDNGALIQGYPAEITRFWRGLPHNLTHVDAVYERPDNKIVFFIDDKYYVFTANKMEWGYPRPLTDLGLPSSLKKIDGAMIWGHNGKTYFYSGSSYWRFDEEVKKVELDYPRDMSMWKGVGTDIDAVFQWKDGRTYFFKGKGFWKFNDQHMRVEHEQQKPSGPFWMGCSNNLEGNDVGHKLPYKHFEPSASSTILINHTLLIILSIIYCFNWM